VQFLKNDKAYYMTNEIYNGFAVYCNKRRPFGVISPNGDRNAICNTRTVPKRIRKYLIEIEDKRFYEHGAVDIKGITRATLANLKAGKIVQGGSTITQQLARNQIRDNRKNIIRKIRETALAFNIERHNNKDEIIDLYLNKVFWGKKNYGIRAACLDYFKKEPENLNTKEQLILLTLLRGPNYYLNNDVVLEKRCNLLSSILLERNVINQRKFSQIKKSESKIESNLLEVFRSETVPFITKSINTKQYSIYSTLNVELQNEVTKFISNSKYPTSIIGISNGEIICVGSSNGSDYPFLYRSNVGSTLKPFIYSILRQSGYSSSSIFSTTTKNSIDWDIREAQSVSSELLSLEDALFLSNNNTFVNAAYECGMEELLSSLSKILNKPKSNLVPSSVLGATIDGLTLFELVKSYESFFCDYKSNPIKSECISILNKIAVDKFYGEFSNSFLKTGTTNFNKERFAIVGYANTLFGFLRQGNEINDYSKEGGFISSILGFLQNISRKKYKWSSENE